MNEQKSDWMTFENLTGTQKAAILLVAIGADAASQILRNMSQEDVERITKEISRLRNIPSKVINEVVNEYYKMILAQNYISEGGTKYAEQLLEKAMGKEQSAMLLKKLENLDKEQPKGFKRLKSVSVEQIVNFLQKEHPQTIAVVLAHMDSQKAAKIFEELPNELQVDVAYRIARLDQISPDLVEEVEDYLESHFRGQFNKTFGDVDGERVVADLLNMVGKITEKSVMEGLAKIDHDLATEIKNLMFTFDDLILVDDRSIQKILKEVDTKELSIALKGASEEVKEKIFRNMSERAANMLREEMEYLGPLRVKDVEEAQKRILAIVSNLEESGDIVIHREGSEQDVIL
ncbi:MAG TPA: flagellar motor switch protein FliG [Bacteroidetes bacterium]|nr:flagellar motor switch protein FliG [Bacteroidota bacterium]